MREKGLTSGITGTIIFCKHTHANVLQLWYLDRYADNNLFYPCHVILLTTATDIHSYKYIQSTPYGYDMNMDLTY